MFKFEKDAVFTVDEVTNKIREAIYASGELQNISVKGELLGFKKHSSGHAYFTVIGAEARISCVLFRSNASSVILWPKDGDEVLVRGRVDVYGARGSYQIYATTLLPLGEGAKARAREILFKQLTAEGLFDIRHKRPLPSFPRKVALITSPTGAAVQDVIKIASIRYPASELLVIPSLMQGAAASSEIKEAFSKCAALQDISLVMLVRGGGSRDDLDTFDSEEVVRAVRSCPVPVITGLGHQIDKTLSDLAADAYAPTPSGAAERVFPDSKELTAYLKSSMRSMNAHINKRAAKISSDLTDSKRRLLFSITRGVYIPASEFLNNARSSLSSNITYKLSEAEAKLSSAAGTLNNLSPLSVMSRGFTVCRDAEGNMIKDASSLSEKQRVGIFFRDGKAEAEVISICREN
ncbi:MAG: exodeoxyribonuclease VII large subunit [Synergistaceae bacterium]|jgi:exodeoxyribonuclease VII large subunit|nr:exodeoxyribonuclease VII large subunit [Synergistaceae bacterium]MDD2350125.1 exodeoxyribonuclease VII large subunit [Synergistaceae bacterium]MDD3318635.1 exodeoxyribonuclease VII large subunit [Synergistaceae bacterium]MDD3671992.1 exodeoxyribonuclease VII large subunit [Synergistaceae bacterium]